jgi:hypothetical protein
MGQLALVQAERDRFRDALDEAEVKVAALAAALRKYGAHPPSCRAVGDLSLGDSDCDCGLVTAQGAGEGKHEVTVAEVCAFEAGQEDIKAQGWLSPEVREQVGRAILYLAGIIHRQRHVGQSFTRCETVPCLEARTALAALEVTRDGQ